MNYRDCLIKLAKEKIESRPDLRNFIMGIVDMFDSEVNCGEPETNEYDLAVNELNDIKAL